MAPLATNVAAAVRAEMGRQRLGVNDLAAVLGIHRRYAKRRYDGEHEFSLKEIERVAAWLEIPEGDLVDSKDRR